MTLAGAWASGRYIFLTVDVGGINSYKYEGIIIDDDGNEVTINDIKEGRITIKKDRIVVWKMLKPNEVPDGKQ